MNKDKEAKCGAPLGDHKNRTKSAAKAELTLEKLNSTGGCKGITIRIYKEGDQDQSESFYVEEPSGPDLYEVPAGGRLEVACGENNQRKQRRMLSALDTALALTMPTLIEKASECLPTTAGGDCTLLYLLIGSNKTDKEQ